MEDIVFSDWPGQPVDLNSGSNSWLPAYGFQAPAALLEREDFIGNPDAEYFLSGGCGGVGGNFAYLETILEETSDDLRSESDYDSRGSPVGWLATDSETGSVICVDAPDDAECESDRELACPPKRRKQDCFLLTLPNNNDDDLSSLSRSSSLLQFETLEKQCQETCSSSPSIYSQFSYDSLESNRKNNLSPDSLNSPNTEDEQDFYKCLKIDVPRKKTSNDSLLYNTTGLSRSGSSDSDGTLEASRSFDNLKTWRSFESLPVTSRGIKEKASAENLSEDSGYGDHLSKSSSANNLKEKDLRGGRGFIKMGSPDRKGYAGFSAYDGEIFHEHISGNFGVSYQDLTFIKEDSTLRTSPMIDHFIKNKKQQRQQQHQQLSAVAASAMILKLDGRKECDRQSNFKPSSRSEPDLLRSDSNGESAAICVSSVPKDLNFVGDFIGSVSGERGGDSVAAKDWNLADLQPESFFPDDAVVDEEQSSDDEMSDYKREGSYAEAMANRVDLSDDEHSLYNKKKPKLPRTTIVEFDKKVLKAISEQSLQSVLSSTQNLRMDDRFLDDVFTSTPVSCVQTRTIASTPNLAVSNQIEPVNDYSDEERRKSAHDIRRKGSIIKSSTSTSGLSDAEEKPLTASVKSCSSINSKGVHFSPVVSEVNWRDDSISTVTPDRESSYSFGSSSPEQRRSPPPKKIHKPRPRLGTPVRMSFSQPDLSEVDACKKEFVDSLISLRQDYSKSQPDVNKTAVRRGSQLIKKDKDGSTIKAYVDRDGIQYQHTHLDQGMGFGHQGGGTPHQNQHRPPSPRRRPPPTQKQSSSGGRPSVDAMEAQESLSAIEAGRATRRRSGKIGGFFSRLASFRFSLRNKGTDDKKKGKKREADAAGGKQVVQPQQRIATKDDYIYIPLKGPPQNTQQQHLQHNQPNNNKENASAFSKPPLPRQPPRVVHASVKGSGDHHGGGGLHNREQRSRRRCTIDSVIGGGREQMEGSRRAGLIETDLDTEVTVITSESGIASSTASAPMTRSLLDLGPARGRPRTAGLTAPDDGSGQNGSDAGRPHKSMEFLLDKQNLKVVEPPENELQKGERVMSEHQLRVQRSLQKLTVPEWYKNSQVPREGFLLKKSPARESARWMGTGSKTTSLNSLGSNSYNPQSPLILSPTPCNQPFVRWSTSKLNSTASSPCASTRSSFNTRQANGSISPSSVRSSFSYRQPYMGWRSQERLSRPRTPAERLASSLLSGQDTTPPQTESPEIQTSIKEVTSAIVHYVSGLRPEDHGQHDSSSSPMSSQKFCWLESSFVGTRPLDSPQTPVTLSASDNRATTTTTTTTTINDDPQQQAASLRLDLQGHNDVTLLMTGTSTMKPSPSSTTLEDVLDSLLGLPSTGRVPSPSLQETESVNTSPSRQGQVQDLSEHMEPTSTSQETSRRPSITSSPVIRCRYSRCGKLALVNTAEASVFKNCHNCSYTYCSRACRRAHWEKHRKTCLFSRIGTLCRQVIAAVKEQKETLTHLSKIARRGYLSHGIGAVKCFFPNPDAAESFLSSGLTNLGELTYVRWQDLLPSEMGPQLYAEIVKMCKNYNPESKLILYVSVCVISEAPAAGAVKWERQLVSRCAKMRLSKDDQSYENLETLILTSPPIQGDIFTIREMRAKSVENLHGHLKLKGVYLKKHHPEIYRQLNVYCEDASLKFFPMTVFPKDVLSGKSFMCIIMLEVTQKSLKEVEAVGGNMRTIDVTKD